CPSDSRSALSRWSRYRSQSSLVLMFLQRLVSRLLTLSRRARTSLPTISRSAFASSLFGGKTLPSSLRIPSARSLSWAGLVEKDSGKARRVRTPTIDFIEVSVSPFATLPARQHRYGMNKTIPDEHKCKANCFDELRLAGRLASLHCGCAGAESPRP